MTVTHYIIRQHNSIHICAFSNLPATFQGRMRIPVDEAKEVVAGWNKSSKKGGSGAIFQIIDDYFVPKFFDVIFFE